MLAGKESADTSQEDEEEEEDEEEGRCNCGTFPHIQRVRGRERTRSDVMHDSRHI